jgi:hypothetical protein
MFQIIILYYLEFFNSFLLTIIERRRIEPDFYPVYPDGADDSIIYILSPRYAGSLYKNNKLNQRYYTSDNISF